MRDDVRHAQAGVLRLHVKHLLFVANVVIEPDLRFEKLRATHLFIEPRDFVVGEVFDRKSSSIEASGGTSAPSNRPKAALATSDS